MVFLWSFYWDYFGMSIESKLKSIESKLKSIESKLKAIESKLKSIQRKLKLDQSKLKSIENKLKSIESKLKVNWNQLKSIIFLIPHYCVPGPLFFPYCCVSKICWGGGGDPPTLISNLHYHHLIFKLSLIIHLPSAQPWCRRRELQCDHPRA